MKRIDHRKHRVVLDYRSAERRQILKYGGSRDLQVVFHRVFLFIGVFDGVPILEGIQLFQQ